jgi:uncharacterized tellurite resistance protein B-like protein
MGLFDRFKSDQGQKLTPHLAFATCLIYVMAADGEMDSEEVGHLLSVLGGAREGNAIGVGANNKALLDQAVRTARSKPIEQFLAEATPLLTDAQRMCILLNLIDSAMSDGEAEPEEQHLIGKIQQSFGITDERFAPFFDVLMAKNDRTIFVDADHPHNSPDYRVSLGAGRA